MLGSLYFVACRNISKVTGFVNKLTVEFESDVEIDAEL